MLERFHVSESEAVRLGADDVRAVTEAIFDRMGLSQADAARSADVLVYADLKGIDTHGISNMLRMYVQGYQTGETNPRPQPRIVREAPAVATMDGDGGLGLHIGPLAMELAIEKSEIARHGRGGGAKRWARRRSRLSRCDGPGTRHDRRVHGRRRRRLRCCRRSGRSLASGRTPSPGPLRQKTRRLSYSTSH